jgi:hypothetical protein
MVRPSMHRPLLCLALALTGCATSTTPFYPLDELRALDAPESREELLARALEVAPSKRDGEWRGLVERAAVASLADLEIKTVPGAERALAAVEEFWTRYPALRRSPKFLARRAEVGVEALGWVLQSSRSQEWTARVLEFARRDPVTPHLAQRLADEVVLKRLIPATARPLMELALSRDGAAACEAPALVKVALEVMGDGAPFPEATGPCWKQLEGPLVDAVKRSETRTGKLQLCAALAGQMNVAVVKTACAE